MKNMSPFSRQVQLALESAILYLLVVGLIVTWGGVVPFNQSRRGRIL